MRRAEFTVLPSFSAKTQIRPFWRKRPPRFDVLCISLFLVNAYSVVRNTTFTENDHLSHSPTLDALQQSSSARRFSTERHYSTLCSRVLLLDESCLEIVVKRDAFTAKQCCSTHLLQRKYKARCQTAEWKVSQFTVVADDHIPVSKCCSSSTKIEKVYSYRGIALN